MPAVPQATTGNSWFGNNQTKPPTMGFQFGTSTQPPLNFQFNNPSSFQLPSTGTGFFGQPTNTISNNGTGLFGNTTATPGMGIFGQPATTPAFGTGFFSQPANTGTGMFGSPANTSTNTSMNFFGQQAPSTVYGGGLFSQTGNPSTGVFGQPIQTLTNTGSTPVQNTNSSFYNTSNSGNNANTPLTFGTPSTLNPLTTTPPFQWGINNQQQQQGFQNQNILSQQPQQQFTFGPHLNPTGFSNFQQSPTINFAPPQQQQPLPPQQLIWNGIGIHGQVPTAFSHGRYPSIFNPDPEYNSPLFNWVTNPVSGKMLYASSLNSLLQSHLVPPYSKPPLMRLRTLGPLFNQSPSTDSDLNYWNTIVENNVLRAKLRNIDEPVINTRYRPGFKNFKFEDDFYDGLPPPCGYADPLLSHKWKKLDSQLVSHLESWGPDNRSSFEFRGPRIGKKRPPLLARRHFQQDGPVDQDEVESYPPSIGFFEQPIEFPVALSPPLPVEVVRHGPPITNDSRHQISPYNVEGASDFEGIRGILRQPEATAFTSSNIPTPAKCQEQNLRKVQFREEYMPSSSLGDGTKVQNETRGKSVGPRPRSQSHTLRFYDAQENFPCRVITLTRPKYYCIPDVTTLHLMVASTTGTCLVQDFEVGHEEYGKVVFPGVLNVKGINLDEIVIFKHKEVQLYPDDVKPRYGQELNRLAIVTLENVWPLDKTTGEWITNKVKIDAMGYENMLQRSCARFHGNFISYNPESGLWTFGIQLPPTAPTDILH